MRADVTGLMVKPSPGWERRVEELCKPEYFTVEVTIRDVVVGALTADELTRLGYKIELVRVAAQLMAAGMLKGVLKYPSDTWSVETWVSHLLGEGADQMNYQLLLADAYARTSKTPFDGVTEELNAK